MIAKSTDRKALSRAGLRSAAIQSTIIAGAMVLSSLLAGPVAQAASGTAWVASNQVQVIDLASGEATGRIALGRSVQDITFTADGREALVAASDGVHVYDADSLQLRHRLGERAVISVAVHGDRAFAIAMPSADAIEAEYAQGSQPRRELRSYDIRTGEELATWKLGARAHRVEVSPDGRSLYVLEVDTRSVDVYSPTGTLRESIAVAEDARPGSYICTDMVLSPDGQRLAVSISGATAAYIADVDLTATGAERVWLQDLANAYRVRGVEFTADSESVYVSALDSVVKYNGNGLPVSWQGYPQLFTHIVRIPGSSDVVMAAPVVDREGAGGLVVADADGLMVSEVRLPEMSPSAIAIRPGS